jgi:hypothetical protein
LALLDPISGNVPNLGPNDGAYIFPLSVLPFHDFRPVLQAAGKAFLGISVLPEGTWDEMSLWLCDGSHVSASRQGKKGAEQKSFEASPHVLKSPGNSWSYLRIAHFTSRPGHADQLHLDLWWRGLNIALDPGTYLYNAPAPWDNSLTSTFVHNTVTVNEQEQMYRASRFLYLDWAQGDVLSRETNQDDELVSLVAQHNGYCHFGLIHQRKVTAKPDGWAIEDCLLSQKRQLTSEPISARLHWLLPDWEWYLDIGESGANLKLRSPFGCVKVKIWVERSSKENGSKQVTEVSLIRAGQILAPLKEGAVPPNPTWGWVSPTYGVKKPALSLSVWARGFLPFTFITHWDLPRSA